MYVFDHEIRPLDDDVAASTYNPIITEMGGKIVWWFLGVTRVTIWDITTSVLQFGSFQCFRNMKENNNRETAKQKLSTRY